MSADGFQGLDKQAAAVGVDLLDDPGQCVLGVGKVFELRRKRTVALFQMIEFLQGLEIHVAQRIDFLTQGVDLLLHFRAAVLFVAGRILLQLAQFNAVVFADPAGQRAQLMPNLARGQVGGMNLLFELPHLAADPLRVGRHGGALGGDRLALGRQLDSLCGERLFVQIPLSGCPFRSEDAALRFGRTLGTSGQFLAAFRDCPASLLLALMREPGRWPSSQK